MDSEILLRAYVYKENERGSILYFVNLKIVLSTMQITSDIRREEELPYTVYMVNVSSLPRTKSRCK
jgi:hypothetical protein